MSASRVTPEILVSTSTQSSPMVNSLCSSRIMTTLIIALSLGCIAGAQQNTSPSTQTDSAPAWSPAQSIGTFAFARNGQSTNQQVRDEIDCYGMAKERTGFDPQNGGPTAPTAEQVQAAQQRAAQNAGQAKGGMARGAAGGAAGGAAVGAIAGNAGKGAAIGAVTGTMVGGGAQRSANAQAQQKAAAQAKAQLEKEHEAQKLAHEEGLDTFQRAFAACMDARGYSVK